VQIAVDTSIPALYVTHVLDQVQAVRGRPKVVHTDNGAECAGRTMQDWAVKNPVELRFIQPGKPVKTRTSRASTAASATHACGNAGLPA